MYEAECPVVKVAELKFANWLNIAVPNIYIIPAVNKLSSNTKPDKQK